jgi:hypothetical protein
METAFFQNSRSTADRSAKRPEDPCFHGLQIEHIRNGIFGRRWIS